MKFYSEKEMDNETINIIELAYKNDISVELYLPDDDCYDLRNFEKVIFREEGIWIRLNSENDCWRYIPYNRIIKVAFDYDSEHEIERELLSMDVKEKKVISCGGFTLKRRIFD